MRTAAVLVAAAVVALSGCGAGIQLPADAREVLEKADEIELFSVNPDRTAKKPGAGLRDWEVFGQTTLSGQDKQAVLRALLKGVAASDGSVAACFNPRHGIRATYNGKTVELVICYECRSIQGWTDDVSFNVPTASGPEERFNEILTARGVRLRGT